ncbi:hypothetical protein N0V83_006719 [Neocucurbitaria cava]|uniref:Uncharacterized protein n=1 Tax=Neocucurbitaria cava TaxID=798079 RepID=A0A9W8Y7F3_9PLEO|nr:hypothetical protein N0V83_006719 [Neocucurbitaria cava]
MSSSLSIIKPGYYTADEIAVLADEHFPGAYNAIPDAAEIAWEAQDDDVATFHAQTLPVGHVLLDGTLWKVSAWMVRATGDIHLYRHGMRLSRADNAHLQLSSPWAHTYDGVARARLNTLLVLCQHYYLAAGYVEGVKVKKESWWKELEMGCKAVGEGMGMLEKPVGADGNRDEEKISGVVQRMLRFVQGKNAHWGARLEEELEATWPNMKRFWR